MVPGRIVGDQRITMPAVVVLRLSRVLLPMMLSETSILARLERSLPTSPSTTIRMECVGTHTEQPNQSAATVHIVISVLAKRPR